MHPALDFVLSCPQGQKLYPVQMMCYLGGKCATVSSSEVPKTPVSALLNSIRYLRSWILKLRGRLHCCYHGKAHISFLQRWPIIGSISRYRDDLSLLNNAAVDDSYRQETATPQRLNDARTPPAPILHHL